MNVSKIVSRVALAWPVVLKFVLFQSVTGKASGTLASHIADEA